MPWEPPRWAAGRAADPNGPVIHHHAEQTWLTPLAILLCPCLCTPHLLLNLSLYFEAWWYLRSLSIQRPPPSRRIAHRAHSILSDRPWGTKRTPPVFSFAQDRLEKGSSAHVSNPARLPAFSAPSLPCVSSPLPVLLTCAATDKQNMRPRAPSLSFQRTANALQWTLCGTTLPCQSRRSEPWR